MSKQSRNDPCPCGSGKKFKKCCESKGPVSKITNAQLITGPNKMSSLFGRVIAPPKDQT